MTVGVIQGGTVCNTVPETCSIRIDTRRWNDEDGREIDEGIEKLAAMNWGDGITVDARRASVSPAMPCTEKTRELVELINEAARLEGFEAGWVDAGGGSDANRIAQAGTPRRRRCCPCRRLLPLRTRIPPRRHDRKPRAHAHALPDPSLIRAGQNKSRG